MIRTGIACCVGALQNQSERTESIISPFQFRFLEDLSRDFFDNLSLHDREIWRNQTVADERNDLFTPLEDYPEGKMEELTPLGVLKLDEVLYKGYESVVYTVQGRDDIVIKYQAMCHDLGKPMLHPLVTDYWYSKEAFAIGVAMEPIFLSPPALLSDVLSRENNEKFPFSIPQDKLRLCLDRGGIVRYMISRRSAGMDLNKFRRQFFLDGIVPMKTAALILTMLIHTLHLLHETGKIIHGDIHLGNILMDPISPDGTEYQLVLIDFGRAMRDNRSLTNRRVSRPGDWNHQLCSPWQVDGRAWGRRDDVYKAVYIFAALLNPSQYFIRESKLFDQVSPCEITRLKMTRFMFHMAPPTIHNSIAYDSLFCPLWNAVGRDKRRFKNLKDELIKIQSLVTDDLEDINAPINYGELLQRLEVVMQMTTQSIH